MVKIMKYNLILLIAVLLLAACSDDSEPAPAPTQVPEVEVEPTATEVVEVVKEEAVAEEETTEETPQAGETIVGIPEPAISEDDSGATIYVYDFGTMILHAFVNPPQGVGNGTYIIEGDSSLVLIDSHFSPESAAAFRAYANGLGKPIDRIYATHEHPDHINGLATAFTDVESYAPAEVVEIAAEEGITIGNVVEAGTTEIDGITYEFDIFFDAESEEALVIKFPDYAVIATGDLIYNDYHMVMNPNLPNWIDQLGQLAVMDTYELILPGHGEPSDTSVYAASTEYLETALSLYNEIDDAQEFQDALVAAYPNRRAPFFLGLSAERMYPKAKASTAPAEELNPVEQLLATFTEPSQTNGDVLTLYGQVLDVNGQPLSDTVVEIWQTDAGGVYDHPDDSTTDRRDTTFQFYGATTTNADGWYAFRTIVPGEYEPRPRHIHYKVKQNGNTLLTSQFYFSDDVAKVEGESMFQAVGDSGNLLLVQLVQGEGTLLANGRIVVDTGIGSGELPLTPSQAEGPFYPVVGVADYDNNLTVLP